MAWPISQDYNEAIQSPKLCFADADLKAGEVAVNALGLPQPCSGNFADVYHVTRGDKSWAVKCFTRPVKGLQERYAVIDKRLRAAELPFTVDFRYLAEGIRIRGQWYPAVKMEWVEGFALNRFVADNLDQPVRLEALFQIWLRLSKRLRETDIAHADLQHGNVLLVPGARAQTLGLKLIDYDGMWVPELADQPSGELGHAAYQHPQRLKEHTYSRNLDRFPHLVIGTALLGLVIGGPGLWEKFDNGDNLLFRENDLRHPETSPVFKALWALGNPALCHLVGRLAIACWKPLDQAPWLDELMVSPQALALKPAEERVVTQRLQVAPVSRPGQAAAPNFFADLAHEPIERQAHHGLDESGTKVPYIIAGAAVALGGLIVLAGGIAVALMSGSTPGTGRAATDNVPTTPKGSVIDPRIEPPPILEPPPKKPIDPPPPAPPKNPAPTTPVVVPRGPTFDLRILSAAADAAGKAAAAETFGLGLPELGAVLKPEKPLPGLIESPVGELRSFKALMHRIVLHPDGQHVMGAGWTRKTVNVWDLKANKLAHELTGHEGDVTGVAISPDGRIAVSCGHDGAAIVWNLKTFKMAYKYSPEPKGARFEDCAYAPDGKTAYFLGPKLGLHAVDIYGGKGQIIGDAKGKVLALSPNGKLVAVAGADSRVTIIDLEKRLVQKMLALPKESKFSIYSIAWSSDGHTIATGGDDKLIRLWNVNTGAVRDIVTLSASIDALAFSPDGKQLAAGGLDHALHLFVVSTGRPPLPPLPKKGDLGRAIYCLTYTPDGLRLFLGLDDGTMRLYRVPNPR